MKKKLGCILISIAMLVSTIAISVITTSAKDSLPDVQFDDDNIELSFGAISDVHQNGEASAGDKLVKCCQELRKQTGDKLDGLFIAGDLTDNHYDNQIEYFKNVLNSELKDDTKTVFCLGNHDGANGETISKYRSILGDRFYTADVDQDILPTGNRHAVINGYHFIALEAVSYWDSEKNCWYSDETIAWLKKVLQQINAEDPNAPIFIALHPTIYDTIYGSTYPSENGNQWYTKQLTDIFNEYPQIVTFSGHVHQPVDSERDIMQKGFTCLGTGSVRYICLQDIYYGETNKVPSGAYDSSEGLLVQLDKNKNMKVTRMDFARGRTIGDPWVIPTPNADKSHLQYYTEDRANTTPLPVFPENSEIKLEPAGSKGVTVTIPNTATNKDLVECYYVEAVEDGHTEPTSSIKVLNRFFQNNNPTEVSGMLRGLTPTKKYTINVYAENTWGKRSIPLSSTITMGDGMILGPDDPLPQPYVDVDITENGNVVDKKGNADFVVKGTPEVKKSKLPFKAKSVEATSLHFSDNVSVVGTLKNIKTSDEMKQLVTKGITYEVSFLTKNRVGTQGIMCGTENGGLGIASQDGYIYSTIKLGDSYKSNKVGLTYSTYVNHLIVVFDVEAGELRLYRDGKLYNTQIVTGDFIPAAGDVFNKFAFGADIDSNGNATQYVSNDFTLVDAKIYDIPLTDNMVSEAYNGLITELTNKPEESESSEVSDADESSVAQETSSADEVSSDATSQDSTSKVSSGNQSSNSSTTSNQGQATTNTNSNSNTQTPKTGDTGVVSLAASLVVLTMASSFVAIKKKNKK